MQPLITQLPEVSIPVSHGHQYQTSCSEVWTQETIELRTVCDKCLEVCYVRIIQERKMSNIRFKNYLIIIPILLVIVPEKHTYHALTVLLCSYWLTTWLAPVLVLLDYCCHVAASQLLIV